MALTSVKGTVDGLEVSFPIISKGANVGANLGIYTNYVAVPTPSDWVQDTAYDIGDRVRPTSPDGNNYRCTVAGQSHLDTEPTWDTDPGDPTVDNEVTWICEAEDAATIDLTFSVNDLHLDTDYYVLTEKDGSDILQDILVKIDEDGKKRCVFPVGKNDDTLKITVVGLGNGALNIEVIEDNPYA
jgi:hypothetical protein